MTPKRGGGLFGNFGAMLESGGFMAAVGAVLKGHSMTDEQAALLIQSHWRRKQVYIDNMHRQLAARHIQGVFMQRQLREDERNRARMELLMGVEHERQTQMAAKTRAATKINMTWRGHLARNHARQLRRQKEGFGGVVRRSLSFGKKKGSARAAPTPGLPEAPPPSPGGGGGTAKRVMRSLSFGKKSSSSSSSSSSKDGKPAMVATSATRRTFVLERGPQGLGLELDSTNTIITVKPGGRAEQQALVQLDDIILSVDGKSLAGKLMQEVMVPGRPVYVVEILRPEKKEVPVATPMKAINAIRRSMSFDKKSSGGNIKRSLSWTTKKW